MNLKKYLVLEELIKYDENYEATYLSFIPRVVQGFTRAEIKEGLGVKEGWTPLGNGNDKLFFFPGCSVPRFKVREQYACTIKPEYATAAFVSKTEMNGSGSTFTPYLNCAKIEYTDFKFVLDHMHDQPTAKLIRSIHSNLEGCAPIYLTKSLWNDNYYMRTSFGHFTNKIHEIDNFNKWSHKYDCAHPEYSILGFNRNNGISQMTCGIYFEDEILPSLNKDNFVVDEEKYQELRSLGLAGDKENQVLMMELMSNCDFAKSLVYLLFLLKEFGSSIKDYKESNHVNFKSLLTYLSVEQRQLENIDLPLMTRVLRDHKKFTRTNAMRIGSLFVGEHVDYSNNNNLCWTQGPVLRSDCETLLNDEEDA